MIYLTVSFCKSTFNDGCLTGSCFSETLTRELAPAHHWLALSPVQLQVPVDSTLKEQSSPTTRPKCNECGLSSLYSQPLMLILSPQTNGVPAVMRPVILMRRLRPKPDKQLARGHTEGLWTHSVCLPVLARPGSAPPTPGKTSGQFWPPAPCQPDSFSETPHL